MIGSKTQLACFAAIAGSLALSNAASTASFDCAHAKSAREKLICGQPELSKLDEQLGRIYQERQVALSAHGAALLRRSELSWLHFVRVVCSPSRAPADNSDRPEDCLLKVYRERIGQLSKVGQKIGPFVFNRIDTYAVQRASDSSGEMPGFYVAHVAYPQIDNSDSPQARAWNKLAERSLAMSNDGGDDGENAADDGEDASIDYEIGYASERLISVQWTNSDYEHGAAHGTWEVSAQNIVLAPNVRVLTTEDLFQKNGHWAGEIQNIFWRSLLANGWSTGDESVKDEIRNEVVRPHRWLFTRDGLQVSFGAYEGGCYACNPGTATAHWTELKPFLSSAAVAP